MSFAAVTIFVKKAASEKCNTVKHNKTGMPVVDFL